MKQKYYHVSLYLIVPIIFAGLSCLSGTVAFQVTKYCIAHNLAAGLPVFFTLAALGLLSAGLGLVVLYTILKPIHRFVKKAQAIPAVALETPPSGPAAGGDQLARFSHVFNQVTHLLSRVDAREFFPEIIGDSPIVRGILAQIMKVAPTDSTVLILGESGTGKELVATSIFKHSLRKDGPFIKLNCVAIPEGLWESELFGHEKGAFTGAVSQKKGKFELANNGTLFLDEIGDMPLATQAKILRVLQEKEFERVGGATIMKVDVRFIAATNKNLDAMVKKGRFREDLFYRLNVFALQLPPLRERPEDIPLLVEHFLQKSPRPVAVADKALTTLKCHDWPGNVRQLQNTIERALVVAEDDRINAADLPASISRLYGRRATDRINSGIALDTQMAEIEKGLIIEALHRTAGVQVKAAGLLGINQRSLWHRIKKYDIQVKSIKNS